MLLRLDEDQKDTHTMRTLGGSQHMLPTAKGVCSADTLLMCVETRGHANVNHSYVTVISTTPNPMMKIQFAIVAI
jgi:hypothetical protein